MNKKVLLFLAFLLFTSLFSAQEKEDSSFIKHYSRNDGSFLENYSAADKANHFPLNTYQKYSGTWTELNPGVPRVDYIGVNFINADTGWACGLWGAVIKTTNEGLNWRTLTTPTGEILLKVHSYNGKVVIVVGHNGTILRSSNGGENFNLVSGVTTQELWGVRMLNDTLGWICGRNKTLIKTTDAGLTWVNVVTGFNYHYWGFDFLTEDNFIIGCSGGKVLKTNNGGLNWLQYQAGDTEDIYSIDIIDSLHVAAAGSYGKTVYSSDGGESWVQNAQLGSGSINWVQFVSRDTGFYTIEYGTLHKTTNRGQTWFSPGFNACGEWQFQLLENNIGYGVGAGLTVTKTIDGFNNGYNLFLNADFRGVYFISETKGFVLSWFLYQTTNGGLNWVKQEGAPVGYGKDIYFLDDITGFICGTTIYKTTNGGVNWYTVNGVPGEADKIFFISSLIGWAICGRNIIKTTDGGENWLLQFTHITDSFSSIYFTDTLNGWASSRYIHQTTDGGITWISRNDIPAFLSYDICFQGSIGFILEPYKIYRTTNSGSSWFTQLNSQYFMKSFGWLNSQHGFIFGDGMYETNDTGNTWEEILPLRNVGLSKFHAPVSYLGYAVGNQGLIYKYLDTNYTPVELISFMGSYKTDKIILTWETASETNNSGFEIEKSNDQQKWFSLDFVKGRGTSANNNYYSFTDNSIAQEKNYYRLKQIDYDGSIEYSTVIKVTVPLNDFQLYQNYPNPFNSNTIIKFVVKERSFIKISLYDIIGKKIKDLISKEMDCGIYSLNLNVDQFASGVYLYRITSSHGYSASKKLTILK